MTGSMCSLKKDSLRMNESTKLLSIGKDFGKFLGEEECDNTTRLQDPTISE